MFNNIHTLGEDIKETYTMITAIKLENLGTVNKNKVEIKLHTGYSIYLWFSYETIVGLEKDLEMFVCQNDWSQTTGKLLNELEPDHNKRIPHDKLMLKVNEALKGL